MPPTYPPAARQDTVEELHGQRVADPYRWLEDAATAATAGWAAAQDELFAAARGTWPGRDALRARLTALLRAGVVSPPSWRGERQFFMRRVADQEHAVLLTVDPPQDGRTAGDPTERVLLDPMAIDPSGLTTLDAWQPSKDGRLMAYQLSEGGTEESVLRVMDVVTGELLDGPIDRARYSPVAWLPGGKAYYYVRRLPPEAVPAGEDQYHRRIYLHQVGTSPKDDVLIFGDGLDKTNYYGVTVSRDGRWLTVAANTGTAPRNDLWLADLTDSHPERPNLTVVQCGVDASTGVEVGRDGRLYVFTDADASRGRLCVTDPARPTAEHWVDLIAEDPEAVLDGYAMLDGPELGAEPVLLCSWTRHAVSELTLHDLRTGTRRGVVPLPGLGSIGGVSERPEGGHEAWFGYTDHTTPSSVHRYDARTNTTTLWADAPGRVDVPDVTTQQITYPSRDGTEVRLFLIHRTGAEPATTGPRPTTLYGYGGFGISLTPAFSAGILAWVEAGGVYAVANLRGGGEEGESWHRDGMLGHKQNVFDDFDAAAEWLIANGWTTPEQLSIAGGSNGGLLVGAAMTQRPDLYGAVVCSAPLLDMVRYEQFGLGQTWSSEYGTAEDPEQLGWLLDYSPYHRVTEGVAYPALLLTVFDGDTRVDTMHARKFAAALQHATTSDAPILLRAEADVGHGARALSRAVDVSVDTLTFAAAHTGGLSF
ncbi:MAG TPA: prolyl oligopeptidase family serine peptidase [Sporichthyaceae bacterium]|jgi:prolyl oligopeptidase|nr:prolyl oligopeptidase family serine peptidase [Sporichthyaceae bacterium]